MWSPRMEEESSSPPRSFFKEAPRLPPLHSSNAASGSDGGARYRLMSPAKLPISRSPCLTIPPGLSPTSFLDSPVLLSNMKVEPSPTTGSFVKPQMIHGSVDSNMSLSTANCSKNNMFDERKSGCFEFKPHAVSNSASGLFLVGSPVSADIKHQQGKHFITVQAQHPDLSLMPSPTVKSEMIAPSDELSLCSPGHMVTSMDSLPAEIDPDELNQHGNPNNGVQASQSDQKGTGPSVVVERSSEDGYNWRKYGQKHVKGSEFPRSYYKCTHPNCEVKKLFERSHDGQIVEIIYKGTHDHPKPQPSRRYASAAILPVQEERSEKVSSLTGQDDKSPGTIGQMAHNVDPNNTPELSPVTANDDVVEGAGAALDELDEDDPFSKRRKMEIGGIDVTPVVKPIREPRVVVQTLSEVDILDDGYRWRKYGQKVVRGNPNPRSYYKCTNAGCPVRKHVERASHDPKAVITTYEGKHNHDVPTARNNSHNIAGQQAALNAMPMIRSEESDTISLDLGVGINSAAENRPNIQQQTLHAELVLTQTRSNNSNFQAVQATPVSRFYGVLNNGLDTFGFRETLGESRTFETPPLNHSSNPCPQNMGRILMGP